MVMWTLHRSGECPLRSLEGNHGSVEIRGAARNTRSDDFEDATCPRAAARFRDCAANRAGESGHSPAQRGHSLHLLAADASAGLDFSRVGDFREQPESKVLLDHQTRDEAARTRSRKLETDLWRDWSRAAA